MFHMSLPLGIGSAYVVVKNKAPALQNSKIDRQFKRLAFSLNVGRAYA